MFFRSASSFHSVSHHPAPKLIRINPAEILEQFTPRENRSKTLVDEYEKKKHKSELKPEETRISEIAADT